jgi:deoxyadenosine/deoxycytidine kinase
VHARPNITELIAHFPSDMIADMFPACLNTQVVPEPVEKWQNIQDANGGEPSNLLNAFYRNPERYAYTFQNYVFVTRFMQVGFLLSKVS